MDEWTRATVVPGLAGWEEAGEIPRGVYQSAGSVGLLGAGYPEPLGGTPMPLSLTVSTPPTKLMHLRCTRS